MPIFLDIYVDCSIKCISGNISYFKLSRWVIDCASRLQTKESNQQVKFVFEPDPIYIQMLTSVSRIFHQMTYSAYLDHGKYPL